MGPKPDPAKAEGATDALEAVALAAREEPFVRDWFDVANQLLSPNAPNSLPWTYVKLIA